MCTDGCYFISKKNPRGQNAEMIWGKYCREILCTGHPKEEVKKKRETHV
jgi:hypothetical protein